MANMGYCRFQNTLSALKDCLDYMEDELSEDEERARARLVKVCREIIDSYGDEPEARNE